MTITREMSIANNILELWPSLNQSERRKNFFSLSRVSAEEVFLKISTIDQVDLLKNLSNYEIRSWLRFLPPDDAADFIQKFPGDKQDELLSLLDERTKQ